MYIYTYIYLYTIHACKRGAKKEASPSVFTSLSSSMVTFPTPVFRCWSLFFSFSLASFAFRSWVRDPLPPSHV